MEKLTTKLLIKRLASFLGGQAEIINRADQQYIYRGEIKLLEVVNDTFKIRFAWLARGEGGIPPVRWVNDTNLDFKPHTERYSVSELGEGKLIIYPTDEGEVTILYPRDSTELLDREEVEGLRRAA